MGTTKLMLCFHRLGILPSFGRGLGGVFFTVFGETVCFGGSSGILR